jgi:hypothetical protein
MAVQHTGAVTSRLGAPQSTVEHGTISEELSTYVRFWSWGCGCRGEIIAGTLIELECCALHARAA